MIKRCMIFICAYYKMIVHFAIFLQETESVIVRFKEIKQDQLGLLTTAQDGQEEKKRVHACSRESTTEKGQPTVKSDKDKRMLIYVRYLFMMSYRENKTNI